MGKRQHEERLLADEVRKIKRKLEALREKEEDDPESAAAERRILEEQIKDLEVRILAAKDGVKSVRQETRRWLVADPANPAQFYDYVTRGDGKDLRGIPNLLAGHFNNPGLEAMILADLTARSGERAGLIALQTVEARATPDRVDAVTGVATAPGEGDVRETAVRVLGTYKEDPEAIRQRTEIYRTLYRVASAEGTSAPVRMQALIGLGREQQPQPNLLALVKGFAKKDADPAVRAVAGRVLQRWEN